MLSSRFRRDSTRDSLVMFVNNLPRLEAEDLAELLVIFGADTATISDDDVQANRCPFHNNNSPTLGIRIEFPHAVNCFNPACTARSPDILSLVCRFLHVQGPEALAWLYDKFPHIDRVRVKAEGPFKFVTEPESNEDDNILSPAVMAAYSMSANKDMGYRAAYYYNEWSREDCDELGIGYDRLHHRIIFPVNNSRGDYVGLIGRSMTGGPKYRWYNYDKDKFKLSRCLLGDHLTIDSKHSINLFEGTSDYFDMLNRGIPNPRSLMGAEFSDWQVDKLLSYDKHINIILDNDKAGKKASIKISAKLRDRGCRCNIIPPPREVHDVREIEDSDMEKFKQALVRKNPFNI